ncbi:UDP-N-acetylglucosamine 2-epimerase (non-hydrolyzing) [Streptococcus oralis]|uniref:non-hydrolyzing UDP-N-acetylglucosamine 2-epimerase n=1 Tax=Streptococcus oralis TaxID=1303 RepID=UPI001D06BC9B|nr:UDP-N-acetylglucosamine 2-epimerase (non-hydrolyzing) [Streptococcus oralis]MCB7107720.1 UDP-N-acetylglucosamine 2-epimerase (non-hydrolyzing) [Streptococcus oralis]MCQ5169297.1 UDP-N-acetylglucosamine 2-epimerase (non-hydrolyzing) [Streptococcus oralis]
MKKLKVMVVFGTRPEAIKMAPLVLELQKHSDSIETITVVTAQHRQMLDQVLETFSIEPHYDLDIMGKNQSLLDITGKILEKFDPVVKQELPDIILVHGDTTTTFAASLVAFYNQVRIGHVEAGLRTFDKYSPFPEEMNRQMTDSLADLYFAPTSESKENLLKENHPESAIVITGNTAIDALKLTVQSDYYHEVLDQLDPDKKLVLVTMHRRENQGQPMRNVFAALREMVDLHQEIEVVYPVHLSPAVQEAANDILAGHDRIHLIEPLDVLDFHNLASRSYFIMTDSGGVQEEAPSLGKPVLVLRDTTERPEGVRAGTLKLVGTDPVCVKEAMTELLTDETVYRQMSQAPNPYGDGNASERIVQTIKHYFGFAESASEFQEGARTQ